MTKPDARRIDAPLLTAGVSLFLATAYNTRFWRAFTVDGAFIGGHVAMLLASLAMIVLLFNACLTLCSFRFILKPVLIVLFIGSSVAAYFMNDYGIQIDRAMIQNVLQTDVREAIELLNWRLIVTVLLLGAVPSILLWRVNVRFPTGARGVLQRSGIIVLSLLVVAALMLGFFKSMAPALRDHRELRYLLTPTNYIQAINGLARRHTRNPAIAPLGLDAVKGNAWTGNRRRSVTLVVVGETARARSFSLNGYQRQTNPELSQQTDLVNFTNVTSCGTATAVSLPCVFSNLGRGGYSDNTAKGQQGLLDVLAHAGFDVRWRDNNSGCKGVCDRIAYEDVSKSTSKSAWCTEGECYDERLLERLPEMIRGGTGDMVIVLHQKGSHGPAYWKRYPPAFERFGPVCKTSALEECSRDAIVAAYDNSILYTDHLLNSAIELLKEEARRDGVNTAMFYFSDHGESLGEQNMYLHGAPYMIAPAEQRRVPMMLWLSEGFKTRFHIDQHCLSVRKDQPFSHDNVFHTVLGMLNVNTAVYNPRLDLLGPCIRNV